MRAIVLQRLLIRFFAHFRLNVRLVADGVLGQQSRDAIALAKRAAGWKPAYADGSRSARLYAALRTNGAVMLPAQRKRGLAFRDEFRSSQAPRAIARRLCWHPRVRYAFSSPTGGTALKGLRQFALTGTAHVAATGADVAIDTRILRALEALAERTPAGGVLFVNCVVNGSHRSGSKHYSGDAADIDRGSDSHVLSVIEDVCAKHDVHVLWEDAYHVHIYVGDQP